MQFKNIMYVLLATFVSTFLVFLLLFTGDVIPAMIAALIVVVFAFIYALAKMRLSGSPDKIIKELGLDIMDITDRNDSIVQLVHKVAQKAGLKNLPRVALIDNKMPNAFAVGASNDSIVILYTGLFDHLKVDQLEAVVAHEIAHIQEGDNFNKLGMFAVIRAISYVILAPFYLLAIVFIPFLGLGALIFVKQVVSKLVHYTFGIFGMFTINAYSRKREYAADLVSARLTNPDSLASALIIVDNAFTGGQGMDDQYVSAISIINKSKSTHPSVLDRVQRLKRL